MAARLQPGLAACALVFCLIARGFAQQTPATFKGGVTLVTVDVAALDADGRPVRGLSAEDFEVRLNGRAQPVRVLTFLEAAGESKAAAPSVPQLGPPPGVRAGRQTVSNEGATLPQAGEPRVFVILIDDLSFTAQRGRPLFQGALRFVETLSAADLVGIATTSGFGAVNPTADRAAVTGILRKMVGGLVEGGSRFPGGSAAPTEPDADGVVGITQALDIDAGDLDTLKVAIANGCFNGDRAAVNSQVLDVLIATNQCAGEVSKQARTIASLTKQTSRRQVDGYVSVINAMREATGIKHLVLLSDGLAIGRDADQVVPIARAAAAAGIQVSVLMEERDDTDMSDEGRRAGAVGARAQVDTGAPQRRREDNRTYLAGAQTAAAMAGGQFHRVIGDPDPFFERVKTASAAFYRLGVEPLPNTAPGREFSVEAKVKRAGVSLFVNRHAFAPAAATAAAPPPSIEERLKAAIASGQSQGGIQIRLATALRRAPAPAGGGGSAAPFELSVNAEIPSSAKPPLIAMFGIATPGQSSMASGRREVAEPSADGRYRVVVTMPIDPGSHQLRFAVADASEAIGSLELPVEVALSEMGPFVASDLFTAWVDAKGTAHLLAVDEIPAAATKVQAMLELYAPAGAAADALERELRDNDVEVEVTLTKAGEAEPAWQTDVLPQRQPGLLRIVAEVETAAIAAGEYQLRARVRSGGRVVGTALTTVRKR
jgi:VWFA-related protein